MVDKAYFILGSRYVRYDPTSDSVDRGYPKPIADTGADSRRSGWTAASARQSLVFELKNADGSLRKILSVPGIILDGWSWQLKKAGGTMLARIV